MTFENERMLMNLLDQIVKAMTKLTDHVVSLNARIARLESEAIRDTSPGQ
jgi:hypothetical protein